MAYKPKQVALVVFVDPQKAVGKVLNDELLRHDISGRMYKWTNSYLYNRKPRVQVDGQSGRKVLLKQGVPQGGVLPPNIFILYMND